MAAQNVKKIAVVATFGRQPILVRAVFIDGELTLAKKEKLPKRGNKLIEVAGPELIRLIGMGYTVLVEEVYGQLGKATAAISVALDDKYYDGRPFIVVALEHYRELIRLNMISFDPAEATLFTLPNSLIDTEIKPNGETVSRINWDEMTTERMATLLAVYATFYTRPTSLQYLNAMCGALEEPRTPLTPFTNLVRATETQILNQNAPTSPLTGRYLPNGDKVL